MKRRVFISLCIASVWLPACGFRLRGMDAPSLKSAVAFNGEDAPLLRDFLSTYSGSVRFLQAGTEGAGPILLQLSEEDLRRSVASVSADTGRGAEYRLEYSVKVRAGYGEGQPLMRTQKIRAYEDYLLGDSNIGDPARLEILRQELLRRAAEAIQRRLLAALRLAS